MKYIKQFFSICILFIVSENVFAQTAADYYLPLSTGNHLNFHGAGINWGSRATLFSIEGTDLISGDQYFREKGIEVMDGTSDTSVFHVFWLRKDLAGNIVLGAYSESSSDINSATMLNGFNLFPNEFLTTGYSRSFSIGDEIQKDSVISVSETVTLPAGTFSNCLLISESHINNLGTVVFRENHYYAYGVGMVKNERTIPSNDAHIDELMSYVITGVEENNNSIPPRYLLSQNYPNPFNPSTKIQYSISSQQNVTLKVYDVLGKEVATLVNDEKPAGTYEVFFNGSNLSSGVYFYKLQSGSFVETRKLTLLK